jgi:hypothetical protein
VDRLTKTTKNYCLTILRLYTIEINFVSMSQFRIWMALGVIGGLFLLIGAQTSVYAQGANDTSMMGNATNATAWMGNATNATSMDNETGNISGLDDRTT